MPLYQQVLLFPDRAENLERFSAYKVRFEHWLPLSEQFKACFREVYERGNSAILLIHGEQGSGKTLFARRIQDDFRRCKAGELGSVRDNLWHALVGDSNSPEVVAAATKEATVRTIETKAGWLEELRSSYMEREHRVRVFIADDAHKTDFLRSWSRLDQVDFLNVGAENALPLVAERMVELCRTDFQSGLFVLFSARSELMLRLHAEIEKTHRGLARPIELPLPDAHIKEEIVRQNTNTLNPYSYWYCVDGAGPKGKEGLYEVLHEKRGFTDTFRAVDNALKQTVTRTGRPANQNLLTLCTLASSPAEVSAFVASQELPLEVEHCGRHVGAWAGARVSWATALAVGQRAELARKAQLLESEFAFRWVALGPLAARVLLESDLVEAIHSSLLELVHFAPSVAKPEDSEKIIQLAQRLDAELDELDGEALGVGGFLSEMKALGQRRSAVYEPRLEQLHPADRYGVGFDVYPTLRPDLILGQYEPCAIAGTTGNNKSITRAISRKGRAIEFTAFLQDGMAGLDDYMRNKIEVYARMLESV